MTYYPVCLDIKNKRCVVVGGGKVAFRKVESLLEAGARVIVISPEIIPALQELVHKESRFVEAPFVNKITHLPREYKSGDIKKGTFLVIAATDDLQLNAKIADEAKRLNLLINVVDAPKLCNFIVPATLRRGNLTISVSTSGKSPALAKKIKEDLQNIYGAEYEDLLNSFKE